MVISQGGKEEKGKDDSFVSSDEEDKKHGKLAALSQKEALEQTRKCLNEGKSKTQANHPVAKREATPEKTSAEKPVVRDQDDYFREDEDDEDDPRFRRQVKPKPVEVEQPKDMAPVEKEYVKGVLVTKELSKAPEKAKKKLFSGNADDEDI